LNHNFVLRSRKALLMTETELRLIAAPMALMSRRRASPRSFSISATLASIWALFG
jgi:hypothetical protein